MAHPSQLEKNLDKLLAEMRVLKQQKAEVEGKGELNLKSWLRDVEAQEHELDEIQKKLEQLKTAGFLPNKFNIRLNLNKKVIASLKAVEDLKIVENTVDLTENVDEVEMLISELELQRPKRFSYYELMNIITSDVSIGQGGFAEVYRGKIGKVEVAVKVLRAKVDKLVAKQFMNEMRTVFTTSHKNLVRLYGYCFDPQKKALVYEYMVNGSLDTILYDKEVVIQWDTLYSIAIGTARAIAHLHESYSEPIIHFDIKAANVLLDSEYYPKVTDFGLSKIYEKDLSHVVQTSVAGTANYAAPEVRLGLKAVTLKCDVYSFGLMLLEIIRRERITNDEDCWFPLKVWERLQNKTLKKMILKYGIEKKNIEQAERLSIVGLWCIQGHPDSRPKMSDVVKVLEGVMQFPSSPPNPDTSSIFVGVHKTPLSRASSASSYDYNERSGGDDDDDDDDEDGDVDSDYEYDNELYYPKSLVDEVPNEAFLKANGYTALTWLEDRGPPVPLPKGYRQGR